MEWFDKTIKPHFGIDIYATEFPKDCIATYEHNNVRVPLLRSELPDNIKSFAVADFLELGTFSITHFNVCSEKEYAKTYAEFKRAFRPPDWYIE